MKRDEQKRKLEAFDYLLDMCQFALACVQGRERDYAGRIERDLKRGIARGTGRHWSDCNIYGEPTGECDCGVEVLRI